MLNLPWEMAVTQDLSLHQGKQAFYRGKRAMCNRNFYKSSNLAYFFKWNTKCL